KILSKAHGFLPEFRLHFENVMGVDDFAVHCKRVLLLTILDKAKSTQVSAALEKAIQQHVNAGESYVLWDLCEDIFTEKMTYSAWTAVDQVLVVQTSIVSCICHMLRNIRKHSQRVLTTREDQESFMGLFNKAREAITEDTFRIVWKDLVQQFGGNGKGERREPDVEGEQERHERESRAKMITFTRRMNGAGMRSSQRVEMTHRLVKMFGASSQTPVTRLLDQISRNVEREEASKITSRKTVRNNARDEVIASDFKAMLSSCTPFFDNHVMDEVRKELAPSYGFQHAVVDKRKISSVEGDTSRDSLLRSAVAAVVRSLKGSADKMYHVKPSSTEFKELPEYVLSTSN
ncbi:hypothetical protein BGZ94_003807, partial [Podila epigama]